MNKIAQLDEILKDNKDFTSIISYTTKHNSEFASAMHDGGAWMRVYRTAK